MSFNNRLLSLSLLASLSLSTQSAFAQGEANSPNRIVVTNGYLENEANSNEGMLYFPMSTFDTYDWAFRKLSYDNSGLSRFVSWLIGGQILPVYLHGIVNTSYHEFGHASRMRSYGFNDIYYRPTDGSTRVDSFFEMVLERIGSPGDGAATSSPSYFASPASRDGRDIVVTGAGMNNEILLSKALSERIHDRGGSVPDLTFYLLSKLGPYSYSGSDKKSGDPAIIEMGYKQFGKNITRNDMQNSYLFSTFLSGTFFSLIYGNYDYIANNNHHITPLSLAGFTLPDFYTYINEKGLSMEGVMHYQVNDNIKLGISYEKVYKGDNYDQVSPEVLFQVNNKSGMVKNYSLKPQLVMGFSSGNVDLGGSVIAEVTTAADIGLFLKYSHYNKNTLYGERNIPFIDKPNEILAGAYYVL